MLFHVEQNVDMNTIENGPRFEDHTKEPDYERIGLRDRNLIQMEVMKIMGIDTPEKELAWAKQYRALISFFIDHKRHTVLRDLISAKDYVGAAGEIVSLIDTEVAA